MTRIAIWILKRLTEDELRRLIAKEWPGLHIRKSAKRKKEGEDDGRPAMA